MKRLSVYKDPLNSYHTRNVENTCISDYNCGGLALNTFNWYFPWDDDDEYAAPEYTAATLLDCGYELDDVYKILNEEFLDYMLATIPNLRKLGGPHDKRNFNERLICFRFYLLETDGLAEQPFCRFDFDFHYRYYSEKDECWVEKSGDYPIHYDCEMTKEWHCGHLCYDSDPIYLALTI